MLVSLCCESEQSTTKGHWCKLSPWKFKQLIKNRIFSLLMFVINLDILMRTPGSSIPRMSNDLLIITCWWMFVSSAATLHQVVSIFPFPILIWYVVFLGPAVHRAPTTWEGPIPSNEQAETRITHSSYNNSQIRDLCKEQVRQNWLPLLIIMQSFLIWK